MARRGSSGGRRFVLGVILVVAVWLFYGAGQPETAWFVLLTLFVPYLAFFVPLPCRERTRHDKPCSMTRYGWLIGCEYHRWRRILRIFSTASGGATRPDVRPLGGSAEPTPTPRHTSRRWPTPDVEGTERPSHGRRVYDGLILLTAIVSASAGIVQVW